MKVKSLAHGKCLTLAIYYYYHEFKWVTTLLNINLNDSNYACCYFHIEETFSG